MDFRFEFCYAFQLDKKSSTNFSNSMECPTVFKWAGETKIVFSRIDVSAPIIRPVDLKNNFNSFQPFCFSQIRKRIL